MGRLLAELTAQPFADLINGASKYVVTSTPLSEPVWGNSTAVSGPLAEVVRSLQKGSDAVLGVHGGIGVSQSLLAADRVDGSAQWQPSDARYSGTEDPRRQAEVIYLRVGARRVGLTCSSGRRGRTATTYDHPETCAGTFRRPSTPSMLTP